MMPAELTPVIGPIIAAFVGGSIAFLASVFTKEGKTSEFRQAWIDALRNDIAEFVSVFYWISEQEPPTNNEESSLIKLKEEFLKAELMKARIELRINPKEHAEFIQKLHGLANMNSFVFGESDSRDKAVEAFVTESQKLLKKEWGRVKRGEPIYFLTKWLSLILVIITLCAGGYLMLSTSLSTPTPQKTVKS